MDAGRADDPRTATGEAAAGEAHLPGEASADRDTATAAVDVGANDESPEGAGVVAASHEDSHDEEQAAGETSLVERGLSRRTRSLAVTVLVALVVIVLTTGAGAVSWYIQTQHDHEQRDEAITVAAREQILALLTLSPENVQATFDKVLAKSTGGWRQEFAQQADQFTQVVRNGQVRSEATIADSGIQTANDDDATVLVAANAMIRNNESPQGYPGVYRVLMKLHRQDGRWLVSDLQFVP